MSEELALFQIAFGEDDELIPEMFQSGSDLGIVFKIVRFLARRVYELENP